MKPKYEEKENARSLRKKGMSLKDISIKLNVAKSSVSIWVRDIKQPEKFTKVFKKNQKEKRLKILKDERRIRKKERTDKKEKKIKNIQNHINSVMETGWTPYKDVRVLSGDGRWMIPSPIGYNGKKYIKNIYIYEHRYIMEISLGRLLNTNECVHHLNGEKLDNRFRNLEILYRPNHTRHHNKFKGISRKELMCSFCGIKFKREKRQILKGTKNSFCCLDHFKSFRKVK